jgi:hypothetical protein
MSLFHQNILAGASGAAGGASDPVYVDEVFSTHLYTGNNSTQTITNGIDLDGEGGLVWLKKRSGTDNHVLIDTERHDSSQNFLNSNGTSAAGSSSNGITSFNSDGFSISGSLQGTNSPSADICSWTFRKAPGFFDCVTFTSTGSVQQVAHSLGSTPGMIILKRTDATGGWIVWHRSLSNSTTSFLRLESDVAEQNAAGVWGNNAPNSTHFEYENDSGKSFVAYVFAHDDQSFGTNSDEAIIKCGSFTSGSDGSTGTVDIGFEPQWIVFKNIDNSQTWIIADVMRGWSHTATKALLANLNNPETSLLAGSVVPTSTGFTGTGNQWGASKEIAYIAIRRPHKPPSAGTDVFLPKAWTGTGSSHSYDAGFPLDLVWHTYRGGSSTASWFFDRLRGSNKRLISSSASAEESSAFLDFDKQNSVGINGNSSGFNASSENYIHHVFRRAPGFFDMVAYSGNSTDNRAIPHNLTVKPELLITYGRNFGGGAGFTLAHDVDINEMVKLTSDAAKVASFYADDSSNPPTATHFKVSNNNDINETGRTYITYMFATLAGISKVGSYSGTGNNIDVDCGFTAGARFVLIKRFDSTGDWYVYDSARGIVGGNDPYVLLNTNAAEVTNTDYIDPLNSGFTVTSSAPAALNASGGTYIFLAIA